MQGFKVFLGCGFGFSLFFSRSGGVRVEGFRDFGLRVPFRLEHCSFLEFLFVGFSEFLQPVPFGALNPKPQTDSSEGFLVGRQSR